MPKRKFREIVLQMLFSNDLGCGDEEMMRLGDPLKTSRSAMREAYERVKKILDHTPELDQLIREAAEGYEFERIQRMERNILRLGFYELLIEKELPPKVVIAEALRLAKKFSTPESVKFVNALLDKHLPKEPEEEDKMEIFWNGENHQK